MWHGPKSTVDHSRESTAKPCDSVVRPAKGSHMRDCIFCGGRVSTKEHAFPQWILDRVGDVWVTTEVTFGATGEHRRWIGRRRKAHARVRYLCVTCNGGWMSDLENRARPTLNAMMSDFTLRLDAAEQQLVAAWCIKTAMVFECTGPRGGWFYSDGERARFRSSLSLPEHTFVWLGRFQRSDQSVCEARRLYRPSGRTGEGYVTALQVARLVAQVLTIRQAPELAQAVRRDGLYLRLAWPIWTKSLRWPPSSSFSESRLEVINDRFIRPPNRSP